MDWEKAAVFLENKATTYMEAARACDLQRTAVHNYDELKSSHIRRADMATLLAGAIRAGLT